MEYAPQFILYYLRRLMLTILVFVVFFGCCIAGAIVSLLLPEVKGRDPDLILAEEMRERGEI
jgi:MFS transporter, PHS family, inorganic phosphate transporter